LRELAQFRFTEGLNEVSRDNGKRRIYVEANVAGRDLGSFVDEAQREIGAKVKLARENISNGAASSRIFRPQPSA
jgi:cobalt-zinc-cadmium resistance protein CzcA